ncbi:MAG: amidohydrolase family protein [Phycisphaeraceae bacterium]|nr:amidohydrolase family protein [Phycisphaeraceae bacterium]
MSILATVLAACLCAEPAPAAPDTTILHCGTLLDVPGRPPRRNVSLVIRHGVIDQVTDGFVRPRENSGDTAIIDLSDRFVMPGFIDCHVHLTGEYRENRALINVVETDADAAVHATVFARRTLEAGFTTVRDVGADGDAIFAVRDAIREGLLPGPRILAAGEAISATGGHGDGTNGYRDDLFDLPGVEHGIADGMDACRQAVRYQVKRGADVIKTTATGGVLSNTAAGVEVQLFEDELTAIVETAHMLNRKVAAHAHGATGIKAALRAGVDSIEHGTFLDDECIALFRQTGAYLVPTIHAGKFVEHKAEIDGFFPPPVREKARLVGPQIQDALRRAHDGGVLIAFGTDCGVGAHGTNAQEFTYMHEAGISEMDCLVAATVSAADLCGLSAEVGTIEPGKRADIIALGSSPLDDIGATRDVRFVMSRGVVHKSE